MSKVDPRTKAQLRAEIRRLERELEHRPRRVDLDFSTETHENPLGGYIHVTPGTRWITLNVELPTGTTWHIRTPVVADKTVIERRLGMILDRTTRM